MVKRLPKKFGIELVKAEAGDIWAKQKTKDLNRRLAKNRGSRP